MIRSEREKERERDARREEARFWISSLTTTRRRETRVIDVSRFVFLNENKLRLLNFPIPSGFRDNECVLEGTDKKFWLDFSLRFLTSLLEILVNEFSLFLSRLSFHHDNAGRTASITIVLVYVCSPCVLEIKSGTSRREESRGRALCSSVLSVMQRPNAITSCLYNVRSPDISSTYVCWSLHRFSFTPFNEIKRKLIDRDKIEFWLIFQLFDHGSKKSSVTQFFGSFQSICWLPQTFLFIFTKIYNLVKTMKSSHRLWFFCLWHNFRVWFRNNNIYS